MRNIICISAMMVCLAAAAFAQDGPSPGCYERHYSDQGHVRRHGLGTPRLDQFLVCYSNSDGPGCAVECDGGSFTVTKETNDSLTIATEYLMVGETEGCGGAIDLAEKPGRTVKYRLDRTDPVMCSGL